MPGSSLQDWMYSMLWAGKTSTRGGKRRFTSHLLRGFLSRHPNTVCMLASTWNRQCVYVNAPGLIGLPSMQLSATKSRLKIGGMSEKGSHWDTACRCTYWQAHPSWMSKNKGTTLSVFGQSEQTVSNTPRIQSLPTVHGALVRAPPLGRSSFLRLLPVAKSFASAIRYML